ncbi:hypothetical protein H6P81_003957 [Aristolochia fimbriata]|uniref:Pectinesterase n=1 Tax=Aristolochia fimbriata TaxID=158543 RepID=A0AAV7FEJ6_ARIFI|nr:hypothetical protein H6P81_003957 [Aristolochia fimbriata]
MVNSMVARNETGNYLTIMDLVNATPNNSKEKFVIHVKEGVYMEYVQVISNKINIVLIGDGIEKTIIKGNRNNGDGIATYDTATIRCKIAPSEELRPVQSSVKTYLGRPWMNFSTTVIMSSFIDDFVDPVGWLGWNGKEKLPTLYYGEYMNNGPRTNTRNRVYWPGYHVMTKSEADKFQVEPFIQGSEWLPSTEVIMSSFIDDFMD